MDDYWTDAHRSSGFGSWRACDRRGPRELSLVARHDGGLGGAPGPPGASRLGADAEAEILVAVTLGSRRPASTVGKVLRRRTRAARAPRGPRWCATSGPLPVSCCTMGRFWRGQGITRDGIRRSPRARRTSMWPSTTTPGWTPRCGPVTGADWTALTGSAPRGSWCRRDGPIARTHGERHLAPGHAPHQRQGGTLLLHRWAIASPRARTVRGRSSAGSGGITGGVPTAPWAHPSAVSHAVVVHLGLLDLRELRRARRDGRVQLGA